MIVESILDVNRKKSGKSTFASRLEDLDGVFNSCFVVTGIRPEGSYRTRSTKLCKSGMWHRIEMPFWYDVVLQVGPAFSHLRGAHPFAEGDRGGGNPVRDILSDEDVGRAIVGDRTNGAL